MYRKVITPALSGNGLGHGNFGYSPSVSLSPITKVNLNAALSLAITASILRILDFPSNLEPLPVFDFRSVLSY